MNATIILHVPRTWGRDRAAYGDIGSITTQSQIEHPMMRLLTGVRPLALRLYFFHPDGKTTADATGLSTTLYPVWPSPLSC